MDGFKYMAFDTFEQEWRGTTLEELALFNDPELLVSRISEDGTASEPFTYAKLLEELKPATPAPPEEETKPASGEAAPPASFSYKVLEHTKYKGVFPKLDVEALEEKLNEYAAQGYRCISATGFKTKVFADYLWGIVAILEKRN